MSLSQTLFCGVIPVMTSRRIVVLVLSLFFVLPGMFACSSNNGDTKTDSAFEITMTMEPATPKVGQNVMMVTVKDKDGKAVTGAEITVDPQMPAHGHGSSETPKYEEMGEGKYTASPVTLQMKGDWEITVTVKANGQTGSKVFKMTL